MIKANEKGFTLIELMLAMTFFSFILLFVTTGFIIVNRAYNKGLTVKLVQDEGRGLIEELTREIRTAGDSGVNVGTSDCISVNGTMYYLNKPINTDPPYRLYKLQTGITCDTYDPVQTDGEDVLEERVGVQYIEASDISGTGVYSIKIVLSTMEEDLIVTTGQDAECTTGSGSQYCDIVTMTTVVSTR